MYVRLLPQVKSQHHFPLHASVKNSSSLTGLSSGNLSVSRSLLGMWKIPCTYSLPKRME